MNKCKGCGAIKQNTDKNKEGYTSNVDNTLCERCFKIKHYNKYQFIDKDNSYYINILNKIKKTNDLVVLVTDFLNIFDFSKLNIKNPTLFVLNKKDIIPRSLDLDKLLNKITNKLIIKDKIVVGSNNNYNLDLLMKKINKYKTSNNVYVIGLTSTGKSTLINKIIKNYGDRNNYITTSILPSTTLDVIETKVKDISLIDTPGLLDEGSIIQKVNPETLEKIMPKKEIKPVVIQAKEKQTIIVDNIFRIDVLQPTNLVFYMSNQLEIKRYFKEIDNLSQLTKNNINIGSNTDIVIKGLGFIKATKPFKGTIYLNSNYYLRQSII